MQDHDPPIPDRDISTTFAKGLAVLRVFDDTHSHLTLSEVAALTGFDRAAVRRLMLTLVHLGYARRDGRRFSLTPRVLILAGSFLRGNRFGTHVQPILNRYASLIGSTVSIAIADDQSAVYVAQSVMQEHEISFGFTIGSRLPLLSTALGRMLLAYGDPEWAGGVLRRAPLPAHTARTLQDRDAIARAVAQVRADGHAVVTAEFEPGVTGYAVAIGGLGAARAVIGTSRPESDAADPAPIIARLHDAAREIVQTGVFDGW
jgi:IclR family pca regulon transcriptional regulator